jgi:hypothetical protein
LNADENKKMKLPFDFGIKLVFRLVIPGFFLCLGLLPLLNITLEMIGWTSRFEYALITLVIFAGWLITISDMKIYMLFEGRRYWWPARLAAFFRSREQARIDRLIASTRSADELISSEAYFDLRNVPMNDANDYVAKYPSRLGNLLTAFELYSKRTYGIDSIFYWPRIWLKIDKDTREEIDGSQALADSTTYSSFSLYFSAAVWLSYALLRIIGHFAIRKFPSLAVELSSWVPSIDRSLPHKLAAVLVSVVFLAAGFMVYRTSLYLHGQFGELYKSIFDLHANEIDVSDVINQVSSISEKSPVVCLNKTLPRKDQFEIAARYLQYQRYRCPNCNALLKVSEIEHHVCPDLLVFYNTTGEWSWHRTQEGNVVAIARILPD